jgi:dynein heavy chain
MDWFFLNQGKEISGKIQNLKEMIVNSTIEIYNSIKNSKELLPIPAKCHYMYNLRDISKVFFGIGRINSFGCKSESDLIKLWVHECQRVFQDRLVNISDQDTFKTYLKTIA